MKILFELAEWARGYLGGGVRKETAHQEITPVKLPQLNRLSLPQRGHDMQQEHVGRRSWKGELS